MNLPFPFKPKKRYGQHFLVDENIIAKIIDRALIRMLTARTGIEPGTIGLFTRLAHYSVMAVGIGIAIHTMGINLTALFAAGAFLAVAVGFATQNITQNLASGVILLLERSIKQDDVLEIDGQLMRVVRLGTRATVARTWDEEELIVPNSYLVQSLVRNLTLSNKRRRVRTNVGVLYSSDMELVEKTLREAAKSLPEIDPDSEPGIFLTEFGDNSVNFQVAVLVRDPWFTLRHRSNLNKKIWWALKEAGITIAFPQLDVHLDEPVVRAMEKRTA